MLERCSWLVAVCWLGAKFWQTISSDGVACSRRQLAIFLGVRSRLFALLCNEDGVFGGQFCEEDRGIIPLSQAIILMIRFCFEKRRPGQYHFECIRLSIWRMLFPIVQHNVCSSVAR